MKTIIKKRRLPTKFTAKTRLKIYKEALSLYRKECIANSSYPFLCGIVASIIGKHYFSVDSIFIIHSFLPEFTAKKPKQKLFYDSWWGLKDYDSRVNALKQCIKEVKQKIK